MKKITVRQARKLYLSFKPFVMCASKVSPYSTFACNVDAHTTSDFLTDGDFDQLINEFRYYNCTPETGRGINFYVE